MLVMLVGDARLSAQQKELLSDCGANRIICWPDSRSKVVESRSDASVPATTVARHAEAAKVDLVVLTSAAAIESGLANVLEVYRIPCFGPTRVAAHFVADHEYLAAFARQNAVPLVGERDLQGVALETTFLVNGLRVLSAPPQETVPGRDVAPTTRAIAQRFARGLADEGTPYVGWLTFDFLVTESDTVVREVRTMPSHATINRLATARPGWLDLVTFAMFGIRYEREATHENRQSA